MDPPFALPPPELLQVGNYEGYSRQLCGRRFDDHPNNLGKVSHTTACFTGADVTGMHPSAPRTTETTPPNYTKMTPPTSGITVATVDAAQSAHPAHTAQPAQPAHYAHSFHPAHPSHPSHPTHIPHQNHSKAQGLPPLSSIFVPTPATPVSTHHATPHASIAPPHAPPHASYSPHTRPNLSVMSGSIIHHPHPAPYPPTHHHPHILASPVKSTSPSVEGSATARRNQQNREAQRT